MRRHIRSSLVLTGLFALHAHGWPAQATPRPDVPQATTVTSAAVASRLPGQPARPSVGLQGQPSFWDDSLKAIKDGGWDVGQWIAYRRHLLVEASLTNRYFWFCMTSFVGNVLLLYLFYASRVGEDRKLWKATGAMTELWNWALFADWQARQAIDRFNIHIERCSGRTADGLTAATAGRDLGDLARVREERDAFETQVLALQSELGDRDSAIANLNARIDEVAKDAAAKGDPALAAQLMEKINLLTARNQHLEQQLTSAQNKLEQFAQGVR